MGFDWTADVYTWWTALGKPLLRLVFALTVSMLLASIIEACNWTRGVARVAAPLVRIGRLRDLSGAAFSLAFASSFAANAILAEGYEKGELSQKELYLANVFNSLPVYFLHLPGMALVAVSVLGGVGMLYVGLTLLAAVLRTAAVIVWGRLFLPPLPPGCVSCRLDEYAPATWHEALQRSLRRFYKRIPRILYITVPVYICVLVLQGPVEALVRKYMDALPFMKPQTLSVVLLYIAAESASAVTAAGALLDSGSVGWREMVLALLAGNLLSTPMRAFRHQFPAYAGIYRPRLALCLIMVNQSLRVASLLVVGVLFYLCTLV